MGSVHIELDALNWQPGWILVPSDRFREDVATALETPRWVTDGNYRSVRDLVWERADCLVWLNYPLSLIVTRLIRRTARRIWNSESCCNGNQESLRRAFSRESIILWALQTHGRLPPGVPSAARPVCRARKDRRDSPLAARDASVARRNSPVHRARSVRDELSSRDDERLALLGAILRMELGRPLGTRMRVAGRRSSKTQLPRNQTVAPRPKRPVRPVADSIT